MTNPATPPDPPPQVARELEVTNDVLRARPSRPDVDSAPLARRRAELAAVAAAWEALVATLTDAQFGRQPAPGRWSVGEHLAHLNRVDASYLPYLDRMLADARADRRAPSRRPDRAPRFGRALGRVLGDLLIRLTEPPVRVKVRTSAPYVPPTALDRGAVLAEFGATRRALDARVAAAAVAAGLDPVRLRARYAPGLGPARLVTLTLPPEPAAADRLSVRALDAGPRRVRHPEGGGRLRALHGVERLVLVARQQRQRWTTSSR